MSERLCAAPSRSEPKVARTESERHARRLRELTTQQQKLVQLFYRDAVSEDVLRAEQARITAEQAQVEQWAQSAQHQVDDVMAALDEALLLVDAHQRAYDHASESQRRLLNLAIFEHFTVHEEADEVVIEPQLEAFYEQLCRCAPADQRPRPGIRPPDRGFGPVPASRPGRPTGARNRSPRDANPAPLPGVGVRITNIWRRVRDDVRTVKPTSRVSSDSS